MKKTNIVPFALIRHVANRRSGKRKYTRGALVRASKVYEYMLLQLVRASAAGLGDKVTVSRSMVMKAVKKDPNFATLFSGTFMPDV